MEELTRRTRYVDSRSRFGRRELRSKEKEQEVLTRRRSDLGSRSRLHRRWLCSWEKENEERDLMHSQLTWPWRVVR
jgi:hypothetical protein